MRIRLITITQKSPHWIQSGYLEYAKRMPQFISLDLVEIPAEKRLPHVNLTKVIEREGEKILAQIKPNEHVIALDVKGNYWSSTELASQLNQWLQAGRNVVLLIGGPDGLAPACLALATTQWSLSPLTFPHFIVKILVAEQLYRATSIIQGHPYHR